MYALKHYVHLFFCIKIKRDEPYGIYILRYFGYSHSELNSRNVEEKLYDYFVRLYLILFYNIF